MDFLFKSNPVAIAGDVLNALEARDKSLTAAARKQGHRHVIAHVPCTKAPSILKRQALVEHVPAPSKQRRLNGKQTVC